MAVLRPLVALRPPSEHVARVASVPYDVVDTAEARALAEGNPMSFLHVVRPEVDLPEGTDLYSDAVYEQGLKGLVKLQADGALVRDDSPALYVYRQIMGDHSQVGVVGCCSVDEYDQDLIKKHEKTRPDKEDDRTRHLVTMRAHPGPVFLTYRADDRIDALVTAAMADPPLYDFVADDGVGHTVWRVDGADDLAGAFEAVPCTYVADGHHRTASASRARAAMRDQNQEHDGGEAYNRFLAVLFPANQLQILAYNRVVHDLNGRRPEAFLDALRAVMEVTEDASPTPSSRGGFSLYLDGRWYGLTAPSSALEQDDPVASLDAAILQTLVLDPLLGIVDQRTSDRISFVGGIRGTDELQERVESRGDGCAFSLYPLGVDQLLVVADDDRVLPPKSTWFEPKLRSGLIVHTF
ncbi:MAG: hypothetical protein CMJ83_22475 [Planctomycetes bacterium]|nr:hypothetical protein [Planctomycetota bacterium]